MHLDIRIPARDGLELGAWFFQGQGPMLVQIGDRDVVVPNDAAEYAASIAGEWATVRHYPLGHFDVFEGQGLEQVVADQVSFFKRHLLSGDSPALAANAH